MTKEEAIQELKRHLKPGESVTVKRNALESLTDVELLAHYLPRWGQADTALRAVVMADRRREVERLREKWPTAVFAEETRVTIDQVAEFLGVEVKP